MREMQTVSSNSPAAPTPSLPPRVVALARCLSRVDGAPGQPPRWHLPQGWRAPTPEETSQALLAATSFEAALSPSATFEGLSGEDARLGIIAKLIQGTAKGNLTEGGADGLLDMFELSLSDVPAWAVAGAVRRWLRRGVPDTVEKAPNYNFTPAPQTILALARLEMSYAEWAAQLARRVAEAVSYEDALSGTGPKGAGREPALRRM